MDKFVSKKEVASALGVSVGTINALMRRGLPFVALGGPRSQVRFKPEKIQEWLEGNRRQKN